MQGLPDSDHVACLGHMGCRIQVFPVFKLERTARRCKKGAGQIKRRLREIDPMITGDRRSLEALDCAACVSAGNVEGIGTGGQGGRGSVFGGTEFGRGSAGGAGVSFAASGATFTNAGAVIGGAGGEGEPGSCASARGRPNTTEPLS